MGDRRHRGARLTPRPPRGRAECGFSRGTCALRIPKSDNMHATHDLSSACAVLWTGRGLNCASVITVFVQCAYFSLLCVCLIYRFYSVVVFFCGGGGGGVRSTTSGAPHVYLQPSRVVVRGCGPSHPLILRPVPAPCLPWQRAHQRCRPMGPQARTKRARWSAHPGRWAGGVGRLLARR